MLLLMHNFVDDSEVLLVPMRWVLSPVFVVADYDNDMGYAGDCVDVPSVVGSVG